MHGEQATSFLARWGRGGLVVALGVVVALTGYLLLPSDPSPAYRVASVGRGNVQVTVSADGTVAPERTITVGSEVSGVVQSVLVDFNSRVKRGQLLAIVEPATFQSQLDSAMADVAAQSARINGSRAALQRASLAEQQAQRDLARARQLFADHAIASSDFEQVRNAEEQARNQRRMAEADVRIAEARMDKLGAAQDRARIDLSHTRVVSPVDGVVIERAVDPGQTVQASFRSPTIFKIARDLAVVQIETQVAEANIGSVKPGDAATFTVDAYPEQTFHGTVSQVRLNGSRESDVVTYSVMVRAQNSDSRLLPGMTANVKVITDARQNVLRIPTSALQVDLSGSDSTAARAVDLLGVNAARAGRVSLNGRRQIQTSSKPIVPLVNMTDDVMRQLGLSASQKARVSRQLELLVKESSGNSAGADNPLGGVPNFRRLFGDFDPRANRQRLLNTLSGILNEQQMRAYLALGRTQDRERQATVYLLGSDRQPVARRVTIGLSDGEVVEVINGLKPNDRVIVGEEGGREANG